MTAPVSFLLNGNVTEIENADDPPLLHVLRNRIGLKATRFGCGQEQCGACMVAIDGQARFACTVPVDTLSDTSIVTAEGLPADPIGASLIESFRSHHAGQCGYCLSGILISAFVLLKSKPDPTRAEILAALDPHLCRCGAHGNILRAVERTATSLAGRRI